MFIKMIRKNTRALFLILVVSALQGCSDSGVTSPNTSTALCGNQVKETGEGCDSNTVSCSSLGVVFSSGTAICRSDCSGFDVSKCSLNNSLSGDKYQSVIPKLRDPVAYEHATCSDGRPFNFHLSMSPTRNKNWVIFLAGGGFCDGKIFPCTDRAATLFQPSSITESESLNYNASDNGITSRDKTINPTFWDANFVVAEYCTNDLWSGTKVIPTTVLTGPSSNPVMSSIVYTGRYNVKSIFGALIQNFGMYDKDPEMKIVFTGNSAGGSGMQNTADVPVTMLANTANNKRIWLISSAGYSLYTWDNLTYSINGDGLTDLASISEFANEWQTEVSPECLNLVTANGFGKEACLTGYWNYRTMTEKYHQRMLIAKNRLDQLYMSFHLIPYDTTTLTPQETQVRADWQQKHTNELQIARWLYGPADPDKIDSVGNVQDNFHGVYTAELWNALPMSDISSNTCGTSAPTTFRDLVTRFWNDASPDTSSERYCYDGDMYKVLK